MFVVVTANDVSKLPPELLRRGRFDELFFVDLPAPEERKEIERVPMRVCMSNLGRFGGMQNKMTPRSN